MTEYVFDINLGHYIPINEADEPEMNQTSGNNEQNSQEQEGKAFLTNLNNNDVQTLKQERQNKIKDIQNRINIKNDLIIQTQSKINAAADSDNQSLVNSTQKQLLQAKKELSDLNFEMAKINHDMELKILTVQQSLIESIIIDSFPSRYKELNEQMIEQSKIYLDSLFESDGYQIVNEMEDFKKVMGKANMLYGRDNKGYFAVCVDQYDFNKLTSVLEKAGYLKDNILGCCFSQMYL